MAAQTSTSAASQVSKSAIGVLVALDCFAQSLGAGAPTLDHLFPVAVQMGTTNAVAVIGKFDPWPPKVWVDTAGILFKPETNTGKFTVEVSANAPVGPHLIRVFNEQGASGPRFLIVTTEPQLAEEEPNDDFKKPQVVDRLPASLNGRLEKAGDVDSFAVTLEAGQTLVASLEAYVLASPVDAVLRLVDARGVQLAWNHDDGRTLDPFLTWTAKAAGTYVVQVFGFVYPPESEVRFTGNGKCVYRLHLSRGPYLHHTLPLGVQRGARTRLRVAGWNLGARDEVQFDGTGLPAEVFQAPLRLPGFENAIMVPVGNGPELMKQELNHPTTETNQLAVPSAITGCIAKAGDEDRFSFVAHKGERFLLEVQSASFGFPLDAWLRIEDLKGANVTKLDDRPGGEPKLEWSAPTDGTFVLAVGNVLHRGGPDYLYRLSVRRAVPVPIALLSETTLTIEPGKTNELKVSLKRLYGFESKLTVSTKGLPDGLKAESVNVPEKGNDVALKLIAAADAEPFNGPIQIIVTEVASQKEHRAIAELTGSSINNGVPGGFTKLVIESIDHCWLTVRPSTNKKNEATK